MTIAYSKTTLGFRIVVMTVISCISLLTNSINADEPDELVDLEIRLRLQMAKALSSQDEFSNCRIDRVELSLQPNEMKLHCITGNDSDLNQLKETIKNNLMGVEQLKEYAAFPIQLESHVLPLRSEIANQLQNSLLSEDKIKVRGNYRLAGIRFREDNGISITIQSIDQQAAKQLTDHEKAAICVLLEDQIRTHPTLKDYGAERIFGTRLEIKDGTVIAQEIIKTFHQDFAPNAIVIRSVLPNSRRGIDVVGSQSGEFDVATFLMELKLILEQYGLTGDQLNNSSINLASNDVPRIAATLSLLTTQFDESYIGNLHFDVDGKLIVPVFGLNDLEPAVFSTKLTTLLQSENLKGIPNNQLFEIVKHTSDIRLSDVIQNRMNLEQLKGSLVTKVRYAVNQTLVIQGICNDQADKVTIDRILLELKNTPALKDKFPGDLDSRSFAINPIRSIVPYLNYVAANQWRLKYIRVTDVTQSSVDKPLTLVIENYWAPLERQLIEQHLMLALNNIDDYKPRLLNGIKLEAIPKVRNGPENQQGIDYDLKVRNTSVKIQKLDQRTRESNNQALQATIDELDKLLESNPACSAIWYLRAFCYFKQDSESPQVIRSLYNIIAIEAKYPREIGLRGQNTFELNNMSTILLRSKLTSLKNVEEDVPAIHKAFYKTIKN
jgi:hypothetical protein